MAARYKKMAARYKKMAARYEKKAVTFHQVQSGARTCSISCKVQNLLRKNTMTFGRINRHFSICLTAGGLQGYNARAYAMIVIYTFLLALLAPLAPNGTCAGCKRCKKCKLFPVINNYNKGIQLPQVMHLIWSLGV